MANKKINQLETRTPAGTDLLLVGDPATGQSSQATINSLAGLIRPRMSTTASTSSLTMDIASFDEYAVTALTTSITLNAASGLEGDKLILRLKASSATQNISYTANVFRGGTDLPLPDIVLSSKTTYCGFRYNATDSRWDLISKIDI